VFTEIRAQQAKEGIGNAQRAESKMSKPHIEHEDPVQDGLSRTLKDLFAGAVGGVAQVLLLRRLFQPKLKLIF
jgi:hypothetical protein